MNKNRNYGYYPGCSLEVSACEYDGSVRMAYKHMSVGLKEIPDWTCCGASAAEAVSRLLALALPARNLARAEMNGMDEIMVPCSACYLNLRKVYEECRESKSVLAEVNEALEAAPEQVNKDPFGAGWFFKLTDVDTGQLGALMDAAAYEDFKKSAQ